MTEHGIEIVHNKQDLRLLVGAWRAAGERVALVPTMGNLHAGHLSLVRSASEGADRVIVSIFVNPTQFLPGEDFDAYPRTLDDDAQKLSPLGPDLIYAPEVSDVYTGSLEETTFVEVPALDGIYCGKFRPGHFTGVATIVSKLFNLVQPDVAWFGDKDFQQLLIIRRLVQDLCFPIEIRAGATIRESDGLAMSSRNVYMSEAERAIAPVMYRSLQGLAKAVQTGESIASAEAAATKALDDAGIKTQYVSVCRASDLRPPEAGDTQLVVLAAGYLGETRLIDHLEFARE